jgi:hypothetical protein
MYAIPSGSKLMLHIQVNVTFMPVAFGVVMIHLVAYGHIRSVRCISPCPAESVSLAESFYCVEKICARGYIKAVSVISVTCVVVSAVCAAC